MFQRSACFGAMFRAGARRTGAGLLDLMPGAPVNKLTIHNGEV